MNYIIGITGKKQVGKDTVASMINYIFAVGITNANYKQWLIRRTSYDITHKDRIIHFADTLKDVLSMIYEIPRQCFDNTKYKDEFYYNMSTNDFVNNDWIKRNRDNVFIIDNDIINKNYSIDYIKICLAKNKFIIIKLRNLMQYFGTNICRKNLGNDIWIRNTIRRAVNKAEARKLCIISDVRFKNEAKAICDCSLYGGLIKIIRDTQQLDDHISENEDIKTNIVIENNGTLMQLFYKVLDIIQKLIYK